MPLYRPSELHSFLGSSHLKAKKGLSQNFIIDGNILRKIVAASKVEKSDFIIEIGPGPGALTEALLETGATVLAIEMDRDFAEKLKRLQTADNRLEIIEADILKFPLKEHIMGKKKAKVISNLPYHICSPILEKLLPLSAQLCTLTLMVQKEFADRMTAQKNSSDYSPLTLFIQSYSYVQDCFMVSPRSFFPVPKVDSAVITLELKKSDEQFCSPDFFSFIKSAFQKRRKTLSSSLRNFGPLETIQKELKEIGCSPQSRPEDLSLEDWVALFKRLFRK
ncbi:MAG TPA: 16S rRNA (adenine(1518)-N(6)/adenine(1519)-N(6))-dimethyltransferase RsmA [Rhabdochlamydiaceae bacterium]|nr:16S rRNA (adenine(1518)-N(6)/adenine(1519)-N(6))-dimethyltransferase RsmA [Rhabdochlamydiaceae bacterium]